MAITYTVDSLVQLGMNLDWLFIIGDEGLQSIKDTHEGITGMFELKIGQRIMLLSFVDGSYGCPTDQMPSD